jgi:hypothetical protein
VGRTARHRHGHEEEAHAGARRAQAGDRRYLSEGSMALLYPDGDSGAIAAIDSGE